MSGYVKIKWEISVYLSFVIWFYIYHLSIISIIYHVPSKFIYFTYNTSVISVISLPIHVGYFFSWRFWDLFQYECVSHSCKIPAQAGVYCDWILCTLSGHCGRFCEVCVRLLKWGWAGKKDWKWACMRFSQHGYSASNEHNFWQSDRCAQPAWVLGETVCGKWGGTFSLPALSAHLCPCC